MSDFAIYYLIVAAVMLFLSIYCYLSDRVKGGKSLSDIDPVEFFVLIVISVIYSAVWPITFVVMVAMYASKELNKPKKGK